MKLKKKPDLNLNDFSNFTKMKKFLDFSESLPESLPKYFFGDCTAQWDGDGYDPCNF